MGKHNECGRSWTIVLAGGDGVRMREYVRGWSGAETPKQYCTFVGTRSLLQHTLDRTASLTPWKRIVIVAGRRHQEEAWKQLEHRTPGMTLLQPGNLDTAAGVFLALSYVLARDPEARVAMFPSDHFVFPEDRFVEHVRQALEASDRLLGRPIVLAATPKSRELEYGWIQPGREIALSGMRGLRAIQSFMDRPAAAQADMMRAAG